MGALHTVLDDHDLGVVALPVGGALLISHAGFNELFRQVKLLPGAHNDIGLLGYDGVVDGDLVAVFPVILPVVDIKNDPGPHLLGQHNSLNGRLTGGTLRQGGA